MTLSVALSRASWARLRWPADDVLAANLPSRLDEPVHAGSLFKLVVARAALAQGLVSANTRLVCPRRLDLQGRRVDCVHPDLGRPLGLDDALAHSCNNFFIRLAERLDHAGLASTLRRLSAGAVVMTDPASMPSVALGLEGPRAAMRTWARVALAAMAADPDDPEGSTMIRRGVARAAIEGTAIGLADDTTLTFAKTATTRADGGVQEGRVVAWRPEMDEAIVVRAPGVAGRDAAAIARAAWDAADMEHEPRVRVGRVRHATRMDATARIEPVPLESYVGGVVAAEGEYDMPGVALEALAVAARSYAVAPIRRHRREGYDVCDTTHCQVFGAAEPWSREAAARTKGLVLAQGGTVVRLPYSASCGGVLAAPRDLWGGGDSTLTRTGPDPAGHDVATWHGSAEAGALRSALHEVGYRGDVLRGVRVVARSPDGIPTRVALDGLVPGEIDASTFRHLVGRRIGWDVIKSHAWDVTRSGGGYRFRGRGKGHGAGLCLRGAAVYASRGSSLAGVMATYAPGALVVSMFDRVTLQVPSNLIADAERLRDEIRAMMADARVRLDVSAPRDVVIEVHPTVASYQRATGRAWWTSASTRAVAQDDGGGRSVSRAARFRIDIAPRTSTRLTTEALPGVLRHELVHVLTSPLLADAPAWVTEGLALQAAGVTRSRTAEPPPVAGPCPDDAGVLRPGSLEAMRDAYGRAGVCVAAALPAGLASWRTLALR